MCSLCNATEMGDLIDMAVVEVGGVKFFLDPCFTVFLSSFTVLMMILF